MLSIDLEVSPDESKSLVLTPTLTNTGDDLVKFSTGSGRLFDVSVEALDGTTVWTYDAMSTTAIEHWAILPGETRTQSALWEHPSTYERIVENHDMTLEEYCAKFGIEDWQEYEGETLVVVVSVRGFADAPKETFEFDVSEYISE